MVIATSKRYTPTEYLAKEEKADFKSEFIEGDIIAMAGASANHNRIALNFCRLFPLDIQGQSYEVFMSDMRLWLPRHDSYTYPDVMVVAGEPKFTDDKETAITNPCLIVEVLSNSTQGYDKSDKFRLYRSLPDFEEYLLIDQNAYQVEHYTKVENHQWLLTEYLGEDAVLHLKSVDLEMSLKDLYKRVTFKANPEDSQTEE